MIYSVYGYGKLKTEASIGLAIRAVANNHKVLYAQFLKDGKSSETKILRELGVTCICTNQSGFKHTEETKKNCKALLVSIMCNMCSPVLRDELEDYDLVILDELLVAYDLGYVTLKDIENLVREAKTHNVDICMTGRINSKVKRNNITLLSDIVTNAYAVKHWYNKLCKACNCEYEYHYEYCPSCGSRLEKSNPPKKGRDF